MVEVQLADSVPLQNCLFLGLHAERTYYRRWMVAVRRQRVWLQRHFVYFLKTRPCRCFCELRLHVAFLHRLGLHVHDLTVLRKELVNGRRLREILSNDTLLILSVVVYSGREAGRLHAKVLACLREKLDQRVAFPNLIIELPLWRPKSYGDAFAH